MGITGALSKRPEYGSPSVPMKAGIPILRGLPQALCGALVAFALMLLPCSASAGGARDPGILLELDRDLHRVVVHDLKTGETGPDLVVATGSPSHATPAGEFSLYHVILNPHWNPGEVARSLGAEVIPPSASGPMGIAKIPFSGSYFLHGGGSRYAVGKSVSLGCLRASDRGIQDLLDWLHEQRVLGATKTRKDGQQSQSFTRPVKLIIP